MLWRQVLHSRRFHFIIRRTLCHTNWLRLVNLRWIGCRFASEACVPQPVDNSSQLQKESYSEELKQVVGKYSLSLDDIPVLRQALTDRTFSEMLFEARRKRGTLVETLEADLHNERLAAIGEASFRLAVTEQILVHASHLSADSVMHISNFLSQPRKLAPLVGQLHLLPLVRSSRRLRPETDALPLSRVFLAVVGAISSTKGQIAAAEFVKATLQMPLTEKDLLHAAKLDRPKLMLHYILKQLKKKPPVARITNQASDNMVVVGIFEGNNLLESGLGSSVKEAELEACIKLLEGKFKCEFAKAPLPSTLSEFLPDRDIDLPLRKESNEIDG